MIEWFGGGQNVISLLIPVIGICILLIASKITDTNRGGRYFLPAFVLWFSYRVLIGLEQGTLVSFPQPAGMISAILLLIGFMSAMFYGLYAVWKERDPFVSRV